MTLLMREQEIARDNFEKGKIEGREEGIAEGVIKGRKEGIAEGVIKGRQEGREEGIAEGIKKIIEIYREELNFEDEIIVQKLMKKYDLTREEAEKYLK